MHNLSRVRPSRRTHRFFLVLVAMLAVLGGVLTSAPRSWALNPGDVTITLQSDPLLVFDSNTPCDGNQVLNSAYVVVRVTNTSGGTLTGLIAQLGGFGASFFLGAGQFASQPIGRLAAGESAELAWFVSHVCDGTSDTLDVTVLDPNGDVTSGVVVTSKSSLSANAGGEIVSSAVTPASPVLGGLVQFDVTYSFGAVAAGDLFNLQPAGEGASFDAACYQLVHSEILASALTAIPVGTEDDLYFQAAAAQAGTGHEVEVRYVFRVQCTLAGAGAFPYSSVTSGSSSKYSGNFGSGSGSLPEATSPFTVTKTASPTSASPGDVVLYKVEIANSSSEDAWIDGIFDTLPAGVSYVGIVNGASCSANSNQVDEASSDVPPSPGATGFLAFFSQPAWFGKPTTGYAVPAGGSLVLCYQVNVDAGPAPWTNSVEAVVQFETFGSAQSTVIDSTIPTATPTEVDTSVPTPTATPTEVDTSVPTPTEVDTSVPTPTEVDTSVPTPTMTATSTTTATPTEIDTSVPTPTATPEPLNHFLCYESHQRPFDGAGVGLADQFGDSAVTVRRAKRLCAPADKNQSDPTAPDDVAHLTAYTIHQTSPRFVRQRDILVTPDNPDFDPLTVDLVRPDRLLVPASKNKETPQVPIPPVPDPLAAPIDHYKCYRVRGAHQRLSGVDVETQFGGITIDVKRPYHLCFPAEKNEEIEIIDSEHVLMCYQARAKTQSPLKVATRNQLEDDTFDIFGIRELCVPSKLPPCVTSGVFVSDSLGNDATGTGSKASPVQTITKGIAVAAAGGISSVCVSGEDYDEAVQVVSGISIYGGFDQNDDFAFNPILTTTVSAVGTVFYAPQIDTDTRIKNVTVEASTPPGAGASTYGIRLGGGSATLFVVDDVIAVGSGQPGDAGTPGASHASATAPDGSDGTDGCEGIGCGIGGPAPVCQEPGGKGGDGGFNNQTGQNGSQGNGGAPGGPGGPSSGQCFVLSSPGGDGLAPGENGDQGMSGAGGASLGTASVAGYVPADGGDGLNGTNGDGGGGGGGGGGGSSTIMFGSCNADKGGGGGAGGCGGLRGNLGQGGGGGGGSFGVFASAGTIVVTNAAITTGNGGTGGDGGDGSDGQDGGAGGLGGDGNDDSGPGGDGRAGGEGGAGGPGGGGGGGPSACVARAAAVTATVTGGSCVTGNAGGGGSGGTNPQGGIAAPGSSGVTGANVVVN